VLGLLLLVAGIDTAQILLTRFHVADAAQAAAFDAAATLRSSRVTETPRTRRRCRPCTTSTPT